jgi:hypothetical protein
MESGRLCRVVSALRLPRLGWTICCQGDTVSAQITMPIDKYLAEVVRRMHLSRASGMQRGRTARGEHPCKGVAMVQVQNHPDTFRLLWCCRVCGQRCTLSTLWLAFPRMDHGDADVEGEWVHRSCIKTRRMTLMSGIEALRHLAASLEDIAGNPDLARQRPGPSKAKA